MRALGCCLDGGAPRASARILLHHVGLEFPLQVPYLKGRNRVLHTKDGVDRPRGSVLGGEIAEVIARRRRTHPCFGWCCRADWKRRHSRLAKSLGWDEEPQCQQEGLTMFLENLIQAANDLFANFWLIVIILLPFVLLLGWLLS